MDCHAVFSKPLAMTKWGRIYRFAMTLYLQKSPERSKKQNKITKSNKKSKTGQTKKQQKTRLKKDKKSKIKNKKTTKKL